MSDPASEDDLVQLEDLTPEVSIHIKHELQECLVCSTETMENYNIYNTRTTTGSLLYAFLRKFTDADLTKKAEIAKHICNMCLQLINDLEQAEIEYNKLKDSFRLIISKNPLFSSSIGCVMLEPECSQISVNSEIAGKKIKKEVDGKKSNTLETTVKLEPTTEESKDYEIQYTETKWGTVLVSRKGDELVQERPHWPGEEAAKELPKPKVPAKRQKPKKREVEIPANTVFLENGEKCFECNICQRQFKQKGNYNRHVTTHTGLMPFECTICQRRFNRKDHLLNHIRTHTGERPFECNFCLLRFNQKGSIIKHIRTHTGQEPFECNICQKRFKQRPHLNSHIRTHTGEKPYACHICQRRFIESSKLKIHIRTHTGEKPYKCTYCNRHFNQRGNLQSHLRTHTGEKPYECSVCNRRFNLKHHLRDHFSMHTGEKPYECSICKQKFNYKHVMQNHLKVMHPAEGFNEYESPNSDDERNAERNFEVSVDFEPADGNSDDEKGLESNMEVTVKAEPMDLVD